MIGDVKFKKIGSLAGIHTNLLIPWGIVVVYVLVPCHEPGIYADSDDDTNGGRDESEEVGRSNVIQVDEPVVRTHTWF